MGSTAPRQSKAGRRPRLLLVTPDFPPAPGGIQVVAQRVAAGVRGFETLVIAPDSPGAAAYDADQALRVRRVRRGEGLRGGSNALMNASAVRRALRFEPDITLSTHIAASPAAAAIRYALGARTVQYFHAEEIASKPRLAAFAARHADASIAVSAYTAGLVKATGATPASLHVIGNGTDIPSDPTRRPAKRPTILTIARIEERYKGHDVMVRALPLILAKVPQAQWIVIGDGSLRAGLEHLARSHGVADSISFLGAVSDADRNAWLRRAWLLAMPSRLPAGGFAGEGFGIVYLEAGAYGIPVVAGNVAGALDAVENGETGLLVDPLDALAVEGAISLLLLDAGRARRLGSAGQLRARRLAWPEVAQRVEGVLLEQLEAPRSGAIRGRPRGSRGQTP